jgi:hypothetical protein
VLVLAIVLLVGVSSANAAHAISSGVVPDEVCSVLGNPFGKAAADKLPDIVTGGKHSGGLGWSVLVEIGVERCAQQDLLAALGRSKDFLATRLASTSTPSLSTFRSVLPPVPTYDDVSSGLHRRYPGTSPQLVESLADDLCLDVTGQRASSAAADVQESFPSIDIDSLHAVSQITSIVVNRCPGITNLQADGLTAQLTNVALANTFQSDVTPPFVLGPMWARTDVPTTISLRWSGLDNGGSVQSFDISILERGGSWRSLLQHTTERSATVVRVSVASPPTFAVRAIDASGNVSGWSYMTPCMNCG